MAPLSTKHVFPEA
ncbi:hypothetical protein EE612_054994 [Oryza sativa]|nr:hypothetical protein EE612_054994 [Oryza sativa]